MLDAWLAQNLRCPIDRADLNEINEELVCPSGHRFAIFDSVPVLSIREAEPTLHVIRSSIDQAQKQELRDNDPLCLRTIGIDEDQREAVLRDFQMQKSIVDPVVNYLVAHTNGILYKHLVGKLESYPIPEISLPPGNGAYILDIGCSWGRWCFASARKGYIPIGIDPSLGAVLAGRRVAKSLGFDIKWIVGDARYLPFKSGIFDVVHSYSVFQHFKIQDITTSFKEVARVLKLDGFAQIQLANCYGVRSFYHQARRGFREPQGFEVRYLNPKTIKKLFPASSYKVALKSDCYFGLGLQKADSHLMPYWKKMLLWLSELLKKVSSRFRPLRLIADSVFLVASHR